MIKLLRWQLSMMVRLRWAHLAICAGFSVNGVAKLHTEILKHQELKDFL